MMSFILSLVYPQKEETDFNHIEMMRCLFQHTSSGLVRRTNAPIGKRKERATACLTIGDPS
ncbi:hypothetical protein ABEV38_19120 [Parageobacillus thermoglucosidasius]|uniref:hypothetical protein n=1 Tax=Parageobacillus TaxID=1906945 RepID=UPI0002E798CD|nr:hypothetical protein [Parageobacillus toebii]WMT20855.1 hypothetical protein RFB12_17955 [Parageobacillus toebii]